MDFNPEQRFSITRAIIELIDPIGSLNLVESRPSRSNQFEESMVVLYEKNRTGVPTQHNYRSISLQKLEMLD